MLGHRDSSRITDRMTAGSSSSWVGPRPGSPSAAGRPRAQGPSPPLVILIAARPSFSTQQSSPSPRSLCLPVAPIALICSPSSRCPGRVIRIGGGKTRLRSPVSCSGWDVAPSCGRCGLRPRREAPLRRAVRRLCTLVPPSASSLAFSARRSTAPARFRRSRRVRDPRFKRLAWPLIPSPSNSEKKVERKATIQQRLDRQATAAARAPPRPARAGRRRARARGWRRDPRAAFDAIGDLEADNRTTLLQLVRRSRQRGAPRAVALRRVVVRSTAIPSAPSSMSFPVTRSDLPRRHLPRATARRTDPRPARTPRFGRGRSASGTPCVAVAIDQRRRARLCRRGRTRREVGISAAGSDRRQRPGLR